MRLSYDLHIHSCLSPCGDADMTPNNIVHMALLAGFDMIALTDHNTCGNCPALLTVAREAGLTAVPGMELCTAEEAHVVCLFPELEAAMAFDAAVAPTLPPVRNRPDIFGEQLMMDAGDEIVGRRDILLTTASSISVEEVLPLARSFGGPPFPPTSTGNPTASFLRWEISLRWGSGRWRSPPGGTCPLWLPGIPKPGGNRCCSTPTLIICTSLGILPPGWSCRKDPPPPWWAALDGRLPCGWGRSGFEGGA